MEQLDGSGKIGHLLRRFGLGAGKAELARYLPLGIDGTLDRLLNYEKVDEQFPVSPWEFCFEPDSKEVYLDPIRTVSWWSLRLLLTQRPLQEKLTFFWHNHFAVSAEKVEFGPIMLAYNETLRRHATGDFRELLTAISQEPAMIRWLDTDTNQKGHPNENFAREVMELFTLGIGHYSEEDVREAARAFTGWGIRYLVFETGGEKLQERAKDAIQSGQPMAAFCVSPQLHDTGSKSILGRRGEFTGEQVLRQLAERPETAIRIARKMWEFFAYPNPDEALVRRLAKRFQDGDLKIKVLLRAIAESDEFWSDRCVRKSIKCPLDFVVPLARQLDLSGIVLSLRGKPKGFTTPLAKPLRDAAGLVMGSMFKQGMLLLYPPNVGGWEFGTAWITSNNMLERAKLSDLLFGMPNGDHIIAGFLAKKIVSDYAPKTSADLANALSEIFDVPKISDKQTLIAQACEQAGGIGSLNSPGQAAKTLSTACHLMFGMPEFQFC